MDDSKEKNVTSGGKGVKRRGEALDTNGPVGRADGYEGRGDGEEDKGVLDVINAVGGVSQAAHSLGGNKPGSSNKPGSNKPGSTGGQGGAASQGAPMLRMNTKTMLLMIVGAIILFIIIAFLLKNVDLSGVGGGEGGGGSVVSNLLGFGGGTSSASSAWDEGMRNTGLLNTKVDSKARDRYTSIIGNGNDTVTIMIYTCGTDLESRAGMASNDIAEMCAANLSDKVNILIYTGGCKKWKTSGISSSVNQIYKVSGGRLMQLVDDDGAKVMTDPETLVGFIDYCSTNYPANRNMLIFWDHGGGSVTGYGYDEKYASKGSMDLTNINKALKKANIKFDIIGFDACLMATLETALVCSNYADYLVASEETEPGIGWYYTDWLNELSMNTSQASIEIGKNIIDGFVNECGKKCKGQQTTLSIIDLAELSQTVPEKLSAFSSSTQGLIKSDDYKKISDARAGSREFATSSKIDQVDLVNFANKIGTDEAKDLNAVLLSSIKYNLTSDNMTNAYGISIYFPYKKASKVDSVVSTYSSIGMDADYGRCIKSFAGLETSGQIAAGGSSSPVGSLSGSSSGGGISGSDMLSGLLNSFLGGGKSVPGIDRSTTGYMDDADTFDPEAAAVYISANQFDSSKLVWKNDESGRHLLEIEDSQWDLIQTLQINMFYDDGEGYVDLGLDNVYKFENGRLVGDTDNTWISIDGQPVAYYYEGTTKNGDETIVRGRVPAMIDDVRCNLIIVHDKDHPKGFIAGARYDYVDGETETVAKSCEIEEGAKIDFICDYYSYSGQYQHSYMLGEQISYKEGLEISYTDVGGNTRITYLLTDLYNNEYWTPAIKQSK